MKKYYEAIVKLTFTDDKNKTKVVSEKYLCEAVSVTDAEAIVNESFKSYSGDFEVKQVTESRIVDVLKK